MRQPEFNNPPAPTRSIDIRIDTERPGHAISPLLYGQFIEHAGRCVYDGIWVGPDSAIPNDGGIRLDIVEALRPLELPVIRWPGGLWADSYHWRDGIGPASSRPIRQNLGWNTVETNAFGTHEFIRFCRLVGAEPYVCVNTGSGTVREAVEWVEYCNSRQDTTITRERAGNGSPEPFGVKYWGLGNEPFYALDGLMRTEHYTDVARRYAGYIKHVASQRALRTDPGFHDVSVIWGVPPAAGLEPPGGAYVDMIAVHRYATLADDPPRYQDDLRVALGKLEKDVREASERSIELSTPGHECFVAVDEWGKWNQDEATASNGLAQRGLFGDAIFAATAFHVFHRYPRVRMANLAQTVNILQALVLTDGPAFCVTPTYHVWTLLKAHRSGRGLPWEIVHAGGRTTNDNLSISVTLHPDGRGILVSAVNLDATQTIRARLELKGTRAWRIAKRGLLEAPCLESQNRPGCPDEVKLQWREDCDEVGAETPLAPLSLNTFEFVAEH